jgi:hypothetical protein
MAVIVDDIDEARENLEQDRTLREQEAGIGEEEAPPPG